MAKNDQKKVQSTVTGQTNQAQQGVDQLTRETSGRTGIFEQNYGPATGQNLADYGSGMQSYRDFAAQQPNSGGALSDWIRNQLSTVQPFSARSAGTDYGALGPAISGYSGFAQNGGFSPQDISNIRARSIAPVRGMADMIQRGIQRQGAIRGTGYSPNTAAALAKNTRDASYAAGDVGTNAEAMLAGLTQQGKLSGLGGLANIGLGTFGPSLSASLGARGQDLSAILGAGGQSLNALSGMTGLYGTTPGLSNMFGNQVLGSVGQQLQGQGLQGDVGRTAIQGQLGAAQVPSNFQNVLGNIKKIGGIVGEGARAFVPTGG